MVDPRNLRDDLRSTDLRAEDGILPYELAVTDRAVIENSVPLAPAQQQQRQQNECPHYRPPFCIFSLISSGFSLTHKPMPPRRMAEPPPYLHCPLSRDGRMAWIALDSTHTGLPSSCVSRISIATTFRITPHPSPSTPALARQESCTSPSSPSCLRSWP